MHWLASTNWMLALLTNCKPCSDLYALFPEICRQKSKQVTSVLLYQQFKTGMPLDKHSTKTWPNLDLYSKETLTAQYSLYINPHSKQESKYFVQGKAHETNTARIFQSSWSNSVTRDFIMQLKRLNHVTVATSLSSCILHLRWLYTGPWGLADTMVGCFYKSQLLAFYLCL